MTRGTSIRDQDIEELSNKVLIHPISDALAEKLAPMGVHPNWISVLGLLSGLIAAYAFAHPAWAGSEWVGLGFMLAWHIFDGADGQIARLTGKSSNVGKIVDGLADYSVFGSIYIVLAWLGSAEMGQTAWLIGIAAAISHAVQAANYERQREKYQAWMTDKDDENPNSQRKKLNGNGGKLASLLDKIYSRVQQIMDRDRQSREKLSQMQQLPRQDKDTVRAEYRRRFAPQIHLWSLLSANMHTLAIFLFALLGDGWDYFLFEIIGLNLLLISLMGHQAHVDNNFINWLDDYLQDQGRNT